MSVCRGWDLSVIQVMEFARSAHFWLSHVPVDSADHVAVPGQAPAEKGHLQHAGPLGPSSDGNDDPTRTGTLSRLHASVPKPAPGTSVVVLSVCSVSPALLRSSVCGCTPGQELHAL